MRATTLGGTEVRTSALGVTLTVVYHRSDRLKTRCNQ